MLIAVIRKQILLGKAAYPALDIIVNQLHIGFGAATQFALHRLDMQRKAFTLRQALAAEKKRGHIFHIGQLGRQRHGVGFAVEKLHPNAVAATGHLVGQHNSGFARAQRFNHLLHALHIGRRGAAVVAHAAGIHDFAQRFDFRRPIHGGERKRQLLADVAAGQIIAAQMRRDQQQAFALRHGRLNIFPAVHRLKQIGDFVAGPHPRHRQLQAAFHGFAAHRFNQRVGFGVVCYNPCRLNVIANARAQLGLGAVSQRAGSIADAVQHRQRYGGNQAKQQG